MRNQQFLSTLLLWERFIPNFPSRVIHSQQLDPAAGPSSRTEDPIVDPISLKSPEEIDFEQPGAGAVTL